MRSFRFRGVLPASKSVLNRLLILQSFEPSLKINGDSSADDVMKMKAGLAQLLRGKEVDCGAAGTTLRFLALRASRLPGRHVLTGSKRLFERPQNELLLVLEQLGCQTRLESQRLVIEGQDWRITSEEPVEIDCSISSQFASALIINSWNLPQPLAVRLKGVGLSESYLTMSLETARQSGLRFRRENDLLWIEAGCRVSTEARVAECDLSSAFAVAALAAVSGTAEIENWPRVTRQPDAVFPQLLEQMGCEVTWGRASSSEMQTLRVAKPSCFLKPIDVDLGQSPDLFPVLSVLCAFADGHSKLYGAPHLAHKESRRIEKTAELLKLIGRETRIRVDGMEIEGRSELGVSPNQSFDPDHDHRLAMAAQVACAAGAGLDVLHPEVVNKSFPEFWTIVKDGGLA